MIVAKEWKDYTVIDTGDGMKLERWGDVMLSRPDPQVIWPKSRPCQWQNADAVYSRSSSGGGEWSQYSQMPKNWNVKWRDLKFQIKLMGFKHTGLFPEQAANWEWMMRRITAYKGPFKVLNLFGYTGGATLACAKAGASVVHVDASKGMVGQCKENAKISGLANANIRYIVDDAFKFVEREIRRGHKYDAIIMDPPSFGRSDSNTVWKLEDDLYDFVKLCNEILVDKPLFVLINSYTTGLGETVAENILRLCLKDKPGEFVSYELGIPTKEGINLPCGCSAMYIGK